MDGPLDGVRVPEMANRLAAPAGAALLVDMGAAVIKVEPPNGDPYRPKVCAAIARPELMDDPRFDSLDARAQNSRALVGILAAVFASAPRSEWGGRLDAHGVIQAPPQRLTEVIDDPRARATRISRRSSILMLVRSRWSMRRSGSAAAG